MPSNPRALRDANFVHAFAELQLKSPGQLIDQEQRSPVTREQRAAFLDDALLQYIHSQTTKTCYGREEVQGAWGGGGGGMYLGKVRVKLGADVLESDHETLEQVS